MKGNPTASKASLAAETELLLRLIDLAERAELEHDSIAKQVQWQADQGLPNRGRNALLEERRQFFESERALARETRRLAGIRQLNREFLYRWREGVGPEVEAFWQEVAKAGLAVERQRDVVRETLERGRIKSIVEWDELDGNFDALQRCGKITAEEAERLNTLLEKFANSVRNSEHFDSSGGDKARVAPMGRKGVR